MLLSFFSFFMAVLWSSMFMVLIYVFRKKTKLLELTGITPLLILAAGTLLRCFLPIEIPNFTKIVQSGSIFTFLNTLLTTPLGNTKLSIASLLILVWIAGAVAFLVRFLFQLSRFKLEMSRCLPIEDTSILAIATDTAKKLHIRRAIKNQHHHWFPCSKVKVSGGGQSIGLTASFRSNIQISSD